MEKKDNIFVQNFARFTSYDEGGSCCHNERSPVLFDRSASVFKEVLIENKKCSYRKHYEQHISHHAVAHTQGELRSE